MVSKRYSFFVETNHFSTTYSTDFCSEDLIDCNDIVTCALMRKFVIIIHKLYIGRNQLYREQYHCVHNEIINNTTFRYKSLFFFK